MAGQAYQCQECGTIFEAGADHPPRAAAPECPACRGREVREHWALSAGRLAGLGDCGAQTAGGG